MEPCLICNKTTRSHGFENNYICHSCYEEWPLLAKGWLNGDTFDGPNIPFDVYDEEGEEGPIKSGEKVREEVEDLISEQDEDVDDLIEDLIQLIQTYDSKELLVEISLHHWRTVLVANDRTTPKDDDGVPPVLFEYLVSLLAHYGGPGESINYPDYSELVALINSIYSQYVANRFEELTGESEEEDIPESKAKQSLQQRELASGNYALEGQYFEAARRAYSPYQQELLDLNGFDITVGLEWAEEIRELFRDRGLRIVEFEMAKTIGQVRVQGAVHVLSEEEDIDDREQISKTDLFQQTVDEFHEFYQRFNKRCRDALWVNEYELINHCEPDSIREFRNFLERISTAIGSGPEVFYPTDHIAMDATPLLFNNGKYSMPLDTSFEYSLSQTFYYDLVTSCYEGEFSGAWGEWSEEWAYESFSEICGSDNVFLNVEYQIEGEEYESDILIFNQETVIVAECKSQKLTIDTREGDISTLKENLEAGVGKGSQQANRLINAIENNNLDWIETEEGQAVSIPSTVDSYHPLVVLNEAYDSIATSDFVEILEFDGRVPLVLDVFDLDVMSHILSCSEICEYISLRRGHLGETMVAGSDELDFLNAYVGDFLQDILQSGEIMPIMLPIDQTGLGDVLEEEYGQGLTMGDYDRDDALEEWRDMNNALD